MIYSKKEEIIDYTLCTENYDDLKNDVAEDIFRMRKKAFVNRRGWSLDNFDGGEFEIDVYDNSNSYYIYVWEGNVTGCVRLRPSTVPNLLTGPFASLRVYEDSRKSNFKKSWEASRFFSGPLRQHQENSKERREKNRTTALFLGMLKFALINDIEFYEVVIDIPMRRVLKRHGWEAHILNSSFGNKKETIFYGHLPCNTTFFDRVLQASNKKTK